MKRLIIIVIVLLYGVNSFAQNESKIKSLREKIAKSDVDITNPKKSIKVGTWIDRGKLFYDAYNVNISFLERGMPKTDIRLMAFKDPKITKTEDDGDIRETYEYSQIKLHFKNGVLETWEEKDNGIDNALGEAVKAFKEAKTIDLNDKNKDEKKINTAINFILKDYESKFFNEYYLSKYVDAYNTALDRISLNEFINVTDTAFYFFAGFAAYIQSSTIDSTLWNQAINHFEKAVSLGYKEYGSSKGQIYHLLYICYLAIGEPEKALQSAKTGFEKYPTYTDLMYDLINYYLKREENALALEYLEEAVARDPNNTLLLFAQGKVLDELGEKDKSIASYDAAIAVDPNYFEPYFNKSVTYYNFAIKLLEKSYERNLSMAQSDALVEQANGELYKAIEPMEKAYELRPGDRAVIETLKTIYFRLRNKDPKFDDKWKEMDKILKEMQ